MYKTSKFIDEIFSSVSSKYDLMNDFMSFGLHRIWKMRFVRKIDALPMSKIIDVASGTGDIAFKILKKYSDSRVFLCDRNLEMLEIAKKRLFNDGITDAHIVCADAAQLPFQDNYFDYYTISFGIRNVEDMNRCLNEAHRILKPGGKFLCLEFSHVQSKFLNELYNCYSSKVVPFVGEKITKNRAAYEYLIDSIRNFPAPEDFLQIIVNSGFIDVNYDLLNNGIVAIHTGFKS